MKTTNKTGIKQLQCTAKLAIMAAGVIVLLCMPFMTAGADAQGPAAHVNIYHGMSALAEKELRAKEQKGVTANKTHEESISARMSFESEKKNERGRSHEGKKPTEK